MGRYGPWSITKEDLIEVWSYRAGISVTALGEVQLSVLFCSWPLRVPGAPGLMPVVSAASSFPLCTAFLYVGAYALLPVGQESLRSGMQVGLPYTSH